MATLDLVLSGAERSAARRRGLAGILPLLLWRSRSCGTPGIEDVSLAFHRASFIFLLSLSLYSSFHSLLMTTRFEVRTPAHLESAYGFPSSSEAAFAFALKRAEKDDINGFPTPVRRDAPGPALETNFHKGRAFYMSFLAVMVATFLSALDLSAMGIALPTIAEALHDTRGEYTWVASAYSLSSTAFIPLSASFADAFGRKPVMMTAVTIFCVGSVVAGAAKNMPMMIAGRAVQGIGGGGILALAEIITADLVPLADRGLYRGLLGLVFSFASVIGPFIGGALANGGSAWRWLFYLNLPICAIALVLLWLFLSVRHPEGSIRSKLAQIDWIGNALVVVGSALAIVGLNYGGIRYAWTSPHVLAPLILGFLLLFAFGGYEALVPRRPTIPLDVVGNRTSVSGLFATAVHAICSISIIFFFPIYFQACFGASPLRSAVDFLPGALFCAPLALVAGATIRKLQKYRAVNWTGWCIQIIGTGLLTILREDSSTAMWVLFSIIGSTGLGILFTAPAFPVLAPLPTDRAASALAMFTFTRAFFQAWGITIASTVVQNQLQQKLPAAFVAQFPPGFEIAYAAIPVIKTLEDPLKRQVEAAFAESLAVLWRVLLGIGGAGFVASLFMKEIKMATMVDDKYALANRSSEDSN
ncbi:MFS domain-containing protein [Mycena kentingensis (nom. inval.)]|nr:MFS domain-containing protein [Mycena kentingensis (nom. inval.)]